MPKILVVIIAIVASLAVSWGVAQDHSAPSSPDSTADQLLLSLMGLGTECPNQKPGDITKPLNNEQKYDRWFAGHVAEVLPNYINDEWNASREVKDIRNVQNDLACFEATDENYHEEFELLSRDYAKLVYDDYHITYDKMI